MYKLFFFLIDSYSFFGYNIYESRDPMKMRLQNMNVKKMRVVLRVDYNVPMDQGKILDDSKIKASLETINYLLDQECSIVVLSHLGKIKTENDKVKNSLEPIASYLKSLLSAEVYFSKENFGPDVLKRAKELKSKEILVLENTRFLDVPKPLESKCDPQVSEFWASLGDVFVNDAFASSHRKHASTYGISLYLPSCIGFLMQKEIEMLNQYVMNPSHPFTVIIGGAKMDDKLKLILSLLPKCDYLICGGGLANTCLKVLGFSIGESICSSNSEVLAQVKDFLLTYQEKIILPFDAIVGNTYDKNYVKYKLISEIEDNEVIYDIGVKTIENIDKIIKKSKTIFLNGTVGMYENMKYANGTKELLRLLKNSQASVIVGGGDAGASVRNLGYEDMPTYLSSGGGATLEYISTGALVALEKIKEEGEEIETLDITFDS